MFSFVVLFFIWDVLCLTAVFGSWLLCVTKLPGDLKGVIKGVGS